MIRRLWTGESSPSRDGTTRSTPRGSTRARGAPADLHERLRPEGPRGRRPDRRRLHHDQARRRLGGDVPEAKGAEPRPRPASRSPGDRRATRRSTRRYELWPNAGVPGELSQVLPSPQHFEQAAELVTRESSRRTAPSALTSPSTSRRSRLRRRGLRRGVRRQHGTALRGHARGLRVRRAARAARPRLVVVLRVALDVGRRGLVARRPWVRRSSFISASKTWRRPWSSSSRARWCRPLARA